MNRVYGCVRAGLGLLLLVLAFPCLGAGQGLGAVAAREKARRTVDSGKKGEGRTFSNDDLEKGRPPGSTEGATAAAPAGDAGAARAPEAAPEPDRNAVEKPLLDAISAAQERVAAVEQQIRDLSDKLNPMSVKYIYGAAQSGDAAGEEARTRQELSEAQVQLQQARQALAEAQQALRDGRSRGGSSREGR